MRKVTVFSFFTLSPVLFALLFSINKWWPADMAGTVTSKAASIAPISESDTIVTAPELNLTTLPLLVPTESVKELTQLHDQSLQQKLDQIIQSNKHWTNLSRNKTLSIGIVDMMDPLNAKYAAINSNNMVYAASLPKIAVLLAAQDAIEMGKFEETDDVRQDMRLMIAKSSNSAATRMINRVGLKEMGEIMKRYNLYSEQNGGGLWVGKAYGGSNGRIGDPIKNLSHAASPLQVCNYYYKLAMGQLVNPERSKTMLDMLVDPELHHKFVSVLDKVAPTAKVYRKSGTWSNWHTDSALVWDKDRRYIVVALAEDAGGESMLRELMSKIDAALVAKG